MVCLLCSKLAGHKQNEVLLSCYLYYYSLVFEPSSSNAEVPREKPFCASSCFSIIICSFALCVPCNSLHCLNEAIFSTLFFFSPLLWTIRIFWRKLECENHLTPSTSRAYWGGTSSLQTDQRYRSPHTPTRTRSHFRDYVADFQSFSLWNVMEFQRKFIVSNIFMIQLCI